MLSAPSPTCPRPTRHLSNESRRSSPKPWPSELQSTLGSDSAPSTSHRDVLRSAHRQLADERGSGGVPSRHDFLLYELPDAVERFATDWDELPPYLTGMNSARMVLQSGVIVHAFATLGLLMADGSIELIDVAIDAQPPYG